MATLKFLSLLSQPEFLPCQAFNLTKEVNGSEYQPCVGGGYTTQGQVWELDFFSSVLQEAKSCLSLYS